jgi:hypothetical protein
MKTLGSLPIGSKGALVGMFGIEHRHYSVRGRKRGCLCFDKCFQGDMPRNYVYVYIAAGCRCSFETFYIVSDGGDVLLKSLEA